MNLTSLREKYRDRPEIAIPLATLEQQERAFRKATGAQRENLRRAMAKIANALERRCHVTAED